MSALIMPYPLYFQSDDFASPQDSDGEDETGRQENTDETQFGSPAGGYERELIDSVWQCAEEVVGNDPELWRKDEFGAWINRMDYGRRNSEFGWEICDMNTGGNSDLLALRPMQWQNYVDQMAALTQSRVTAHGLHNLRVVR
ncbi:MAG: hypothetical protein HKN23_21400 [Verrucomicrobiales bacterium]|nr:hypothetical protein [Verrucomicrobiales bacterium]